MEVHSGWEPEPLMMALHSEKGGRTQQRDPGSKAHSKPRVSKSPLCLFPKSQPTMCCSSPDHLSGFTIAVCFLQISKEP